MILVKSVMLHTQPLVVVTNCAMMVVSIQVVLEKQNILMMMWQLEEVSKVFEKVILLREV